MSAKLIAAWCLVLLLLATCGIMGYLFSQPPGFGLYFHNSTDTDAIVEGASEIEGWGPKRPEEYQGGHGLVSAGKTGGWGYFYRLRGRRNAWFYLSARPASGKGPAGPEIKVRSAELIRVEETKRPIEIVKGKDGRLVLVLP
jgi:hypothetical protein